MHLLFYIILATLYKRNSNPYFTLGKVSGSSEKLRDIPKVTRQVSGRDRSRTQAFQRPELAFLSRNRYLFLKFQGEAHFFC